MSSVFSNPQHSDQLAEVLSEFLKEQKRKRRWKMVFRIIIIVILALFLLGFCSKKSDRSTAASTPHTALIQMNGVLMAGAQFNADSVYRSLTKSFASKGTKAVILKINSPGGSPVQADYIYNAIMQLRKQHPKIPVYAVCTDICASGAYYVASAANKIYANPASIVGSIGVIMEGFGFVDAMKKIGVTRRVTTAGKYKDIMDPFAPQTIANKRFAQNMVAQVHQQFIQAVENGRGKRLHKTKDIFSGLAWTGQDAKKLGLIDGFASPGEVARNVVKQKNMVDYTVKPDLLSRLANRMGASFANVIMSEFSHDQLKA